MTDNSYIPKYIQSVPWYYNTAKDASDSLAHHRTQQSTTGIQDEYETVDGTKLRRSDNYDAKRDRWHGQSASEWDEILQKWDKIKSAQKSAPGPEDSDDTDYELELEELGLDRTALKSGHIEDALEKSVRDRRDVPGYIRAINANAGGRIRLGQDSTAGIVSDASDFVKESADAREFKRLQKFAWEQNKDFEEKQQRAHLEAQMASLRNPNAAVQELASADLDLSVEASPTLMMMKNRENEAAKKQASEERKKKLLARYG